MRRFIIAMWTVATLFWCWASFHKSLPSSLWQGVARRPQPWDKTIRRSELPRILLFRALINRLWSPG